MAGVRSEREEKMLKLKTANNNLLSEKNVNIPILLNNETVIGYISKIDESEINISLFEKFFNIYYDTNQINHISIEKIKK